MNESTEITCPKCGSNQLSANKKGFSVGSAIKGVAVGFVGIPGGVLWGLKGKDKIIITCLKCGHQFNPGQGKTVAQNISSYNPHLTEELATREILSELKKEEQKKLEKEKIAVQKQKEKKHISGINLEVAMKKNLRATSYSDLEIFLEKIKSGIQKTKAARKSEQQQEVLLKMKERLSEVRIVIVEKKKEIRAKKEKKKEEKEIKSKIKIAEKELDSAKQSLIKINEFHLMRTQAQKEKQIQDQEKIIQEIETKISDLYLKLEGNG